jgi:predicted TIM-barrel fold metal-dependent hydrolase
LVIDFHTHVFPDNIAKRAIEKLTINIENIYEPVHDGTLSGLLKNMDNWSIDISVVQPVLTNSSQVISINEFARNICSERIISFGAIDPHSKDYKSQIDFVVDLGLKGLKFHAEYQNFIVDDNNMLKIYDYALSKELIILHHAGFDPGFSPPFKSTPQQFANIVDAMQGGIIIAAHFGGHAQWDDVEKHLAGRNIYLDTSMGFEYFSHEQFIRIVRTHGADKVLFGSDSPWSNAKTEIEHLNTLPLSQREKDDILFGNAKRLLKL